MYFTVASIAISFIALVLSIFSFCYTYHESHIETRIDIQWLYVAKGRTYVNFLITNMSSRPSTIIKVICNTPYYDGDEFKTFSKALSFKTSAVTRETKDKNSVLTSFTDGIPLSIPIRSARACTLAFNAELPNDELIFSFDLNNEHRIRRFTNVPKLTANEFVTTQQSSLLSQLA